MTDQALNQTDDNLKGETFEEWARRGSQIGARRSRIQWEIGDWWIAGEHFDNRRYEVPSNFGVNYRTCENYAVTARAFSGSRRRETLSFGHHAEVASLPPEEADKLLDWCEENAEANGRPRARG
jgi:hypothetical protein